MKIENVAIGRVASVAEAKKLIRLADVGELEADLKKDLAEEEAKGKAADVLYCESISDELSDLGNLPTIDPESLRGHARWVKNENVKIITVDVYGNTFRVPGGSLRELRCCAFRSRLQGSRLELLPRMRVHHGGRDE